MAEQPRWQNARVVEDQKFVAAQQLRQFGELVIVHAAVFAVQEQESRGVALWQGTLRDKVTGKVVVEFVRSHGIFVHYNNSPLP